LLLLRDAGTGVPGSRTRLHCQPPPPPPSLEFATASPVILYGVRFYPIFARERVADSLQRRTGFHSFIAAYRVFTGSWPAGPARDAGLLRRELWDRTSRIANMEYNTRRVKYVPEAFVLRKQYLPRMEVTTLRAHGIPDVTPRCIPGIPAVVYVDMCIGHRLNSSNVLGDEGLPGG
ncbi:hypothetical protein ALC57_02908, partial [Trachymyrmex cornetzi]